jgi:hypothetical protein
MEFKNIDTGETIDIDWDELIKRGTHRTKSYKAISTELMHYHRRTHKDVRKKYGTEFCKTSI